MLQKGVTWAFSLLFVLCLQILTSETKDGDCDGSTSVTVTIQHGTISGKTIKPANSKSFCAFMGIPFAEPPINDLRFRAPKPVKPWTGTWNATKCGNICVQQDLTNGSMVGSEDCLYLNVYTPQIHSNSLRAVMVWIYGGDFFVGDGGPNMYKPGLLVDKDVVLVTFNYRLGALGFLSTGDDACPGNFGLKDQVLALKWVQENIRYFGGDPNNVTIFGESAGAAAVHYHIVSPLTKGLFHKAIAMEGTVFMPWARNDGPEELAKKQARVVGCPTEPSLDLIECLRKRPPEVFHATQNRFFEISTLPYFNFTPVVEKASEQNSEPYISEDPMLLVMNGSFHHVPWMLGANSQSAAMFLAPALNIHILKDQIQESGEKLWLKLLLPNSMDRALKESIFTKIMEYYQIDTEGVKKSLKLQDFNEEKKIIEVGTDRYFIHGIHKAALTHSLLGHKPIYLYNFAFRGIYSTTMMTTLKNYGVSHMDELRYIFKNFLNLETKLTPTEKELSELLLMLWTNFAKFGNPTPKTLPGSYEAEVLQDLVWEPIGQVEKDNYNLKYLNIGQTDPTLPMFIVKNIAPMKVNMAVDFYTDRMKFWDSLLLKENLICSVCAKIEKGGATRPSSVNKITIFIIILGSINIKYMLH